MRDFLQAAQLFNIVSKEDEFTGEKIQRGMNIKKKKVQKLDWEGVNEFSSQKKPEIIQ